VVQTDVDPDLMAELTDRLRRVVAGVTDPVPVTASIGVCHSSVTMRPTEMLARADTALYAAKHAGRDRIVVAE